ncbi:MAG: AraC family transcriptional regulator [Bacillota bacterium]|nr:AraC family transcriptional regulator [Bacillota bacterium]
MALKNVEDNSNPIYEMVTSDLREIKIVEINVKQDSLKKQIPPHWHHSIEIIVPILNETILTVENKDVVVKPGEYYIINSQSIHSLCSPNNVQGKMQYYGFAIQVNYSYLKQLYPDIDNVHFENVNQVPEIYCLLKELIESYKSDDNFKNLKLQGLASLLIFYLFKHTIKSRVIDRKDDKHKDLMMRITEFVDKNYAQDIGVDTIADEFNLSYGYLSTIFKQYMGYGVKEYINYIRIKKSEVDLKDRSLSITDVYLKNGFTNSKSFYREFRKYHNRSPKEYRESE